MFLSAAFPPKVGQNFLPTGELGTFFGLAVFLGIVWYCMVLCYCNISMCFHPVLARQLLPLRLNALGLHLPSDPKGCTLAKLTIHLDQNTGVAGDDWGNQCSIVRGCAWSSPFFAGASNGLPWI